MDIELLYQPPANAQWLAQDSNGYWWVYLEKPRLACGSWGALSLGNEVVYKSDPVGWETSLIKL